MFNQKDTGVEKLERQIAELKREVGYKENDYKNIVRDFDNYKLRQAVTDETAAEANKNAISKATREVQVKLDEANSSLKIAEAKAAILEKAFENLGFDVKDMKEIIGKLADGLIAGSKVNILKSN